MFEGKGDTDTKRLPGYSIRVSNDTNIPITGSICYQDPGNNKLDNILQNDCERTAQYVWIYQNNTKHGPCPMLEICEVQVFGMFRCKTNDTIYTFNTLPYMQLRNLICFQDRWLYKSRTIWWTYLYLFEIYVGCDTGKYGNNCSKSCDHCHNKYHCGIVSGKCDQSGCANKNFLPPFCEGVYFYYSN